MGTQLGSMMLGLSDEKPEDMTPMLLGAVVGA
jgi:hypothetical protein